MTDKRTPEEINAFLAEKVMGWKPSYRGSVSSDFEWMNYVNENDQKMIKFSAWIPHSDAMQALIVAEKIRKEHGCFFKVYQNEIGTWYACFGHFASSGAGQCHTPSEAISLACVAAWQGRLK